MPNKTPFKKRLFQLWSVTCFAVFLFFLYEKYRPPYWLLIPVKGNLPLYNHAHTANPSIFDIERALDKAQGNEKILGILLDIQLDATQGFGDVENLGNAIRMFRKASPKPVIAYTPGTLYNKKNNHCALSLPTLLLASYADQWHIKQGRYGMVVRNKAIKVESLAMIGGLPLPDSILESYGLEPVTLKAGIYKNDLQQRQAYLDQKNRWALRTIASNRKIISLPEFLDSQQMLESGLVDCILETHQPQLAANIVAWMPPSRWLPNLASALAPQKILLLDLSGPIKYHDLPTTTEKQKLNALQQSGNYSMVICMLDTFGGSLKTANKIQEAIEGLRRKNIPVITIARNRFFSAGLKISACCDNVLAHPSTGTGSLGVIQIFLNCRELFDRCGIHCDATVAEAFDKLGMNMHTTPINLASLLDRLQKKSSSLIDFFTPPAQHTPSLKAFIPPSYLNQPMNPLLIKYKDQPLLAFLGAVLQAPCHYVGRWYAYTYEKQTLNQDYRRFLDLVTTQRGLDKATFDDQYGQGRVFMAYPTGKQAGIIDAFLEYPYLRTIEELAKSHDIGRYTTDVMRLYS